MKRHVHKCFILMIVWMTFLTGCRPIIPYYPFSDNDFSHLKTNAIEIEDPDVYVESLDEVSLATIRPRSLSHTGIDKAWLLTLEEAVHTTLSNAKVLRSLGAVTVGQQSRGTLSTPGGSGATDQFISNPAVIATIYDPALSDANPATGIAAANSQFDALAGINMFWEKNDNPRNNSVAGALGGFFARNFEQDSGNWQAQVTKRSAHGSTFQLSNTIVYDQNNNPTRVEPSDWNVLFQAQVTQPLLRGRGALFNRIAGPGATPGNLTNLNGIALARINTDISLARFEAGVRNMVSDVERAYWELFFAYHNLEATREGRDSSLGTWQRIYALFIEGARGGEAENEAQAREQYFLFRSQMESALTSLFAAEARLRQIMGLAATDNRMIRPINEPITAKIVFDWHKVHTDALTRSVELRQQKWLIKRRELELIAAKNFLLPQLDLVGRYGWEGLGDDFWDANSHHGPGLPGSNAIEQLTDGRFQSWRMGFQFTKTIGDRLEKAGVRFTELQLIREKARYRDQELYVSHQMAGAIREQEGLYVLTQTNFNRWAAAKKQVEAVNEAYKAGTATLDLLLDAQRRQADAEIEYFRTLTNYTVAITQIYFRDGSLLQERGITLGEGPWPGKANFDAERSAAKRDASLFIDYGMTRPQVFSKGPYMQHQNELEIIEEVEEIPAGQPKSIKDERSSNQPYYSPTASSGTLQQPRNLGTNRTTVSNKAAANNFWGDLGLERQNGRRVNHQTSGQRLRHENSKATQTDRTSAIR